jgi:hypothetical protein
VRQVKVSVRWIVVGSVGFEKSWVRLFFDLGLELVGSYGNGFCVPYVQEQVDWKGWLVPLDVGLRGLTLVKGFVRAVADQIVMDKSVFVLAGRVFVDRGKIWVEKTNPDR